MPTEITVPFMFRMPASLKRRIVERAAAAGLSINAYCIRCFELCAPDTTAPLPAYVPAPMLEPRLDRNLTVLKMGEFMHHKAVRLVVYQDGEEGGRYIADILEGPPSHIIRTFNLNRVRYDVAKQVAMLEIPTP